MISSPASCNRPTAAAFGEDMPCTAQSTICSLWRAGSALSNGRGNGGIGKGIARALAGAGALISAIAARDADQDAPRPSTR